MGSIEVPEKYRVHMVTMAVAITGGMLGGLVNAVAQSFSVLIHFSGESGWFTGFPNYSFEAHLAWGALWGLIFMFPAHKYLGNFWIRGVLFGVPPTALMLLVQLPITSEGFFGIYYGFLTPLYVLVSYTLTWSVPAYVWVGLCGFAGRVDDTFQAAFAVDTDGDDLLP